MSEEQKKYHIKKLFSQLQITEAEFCRRYKVNQGTAAKIRDGKEAARVSSINRVLAGFSELYKLELSIENVGGLNIAGNYGTEEVQE